MSVLSRPELATSVCTACKLVIALAAVQQQLRYRWSHATLFHDSYQQSVLEKGSQPSSEAEDSAERELPKTPS